MLMCWSADNTSTDIPHQLVLVVGFRYFVIFFVFIYFRVFRVLYFRSNLPTFKNLRIFNYIVELNGPARVNPTGDTARLEPKPPATENMVRKIERLSESTERDGSEN